MLNKHNPHNIPNLNSGFTLIELMVVIAIIAVLSVVGVVVFTNVQKSARDSAATANLNAIAKAYETKYLNTGSYLTGSSPTIDSSYFAGGAVPSDSSYLIITNNTSGGLKICSPINGNTSTCTDSSTTCFCKGVAQATPPDTTTTNSHYSLIADGTVTSTTSPQASPTPTPNPTPSTPPPPPAAQNPYQYQRIVTIASSSNLTNYQVPITINTASLITAGKMKNNCSDILVTDANNAILPHWIETGNNCNSASTKIWIKVPSITSNTTVNLFYGNPTATNIESGDQVFDLFDDFSGGSINIAKWNIIQGAITPTQVSGELKIAGNTTGQQQNSTYGVTSKSTFPLSFTSETRFSIVKPNSNYNTNEYKATVGSGLLQLKRLSGTLKIGYWSGSAWVFPATSGYTSSGYINFMLKVQPSKVEFFENNILKATRNATITSQGVSLIAGPDVVTSYDARYDWVFVRGYSASEPITSVGAEQGT